MQIVNNARTKWSSYLDYILVTTGAVIGLGNLFNFPYLALKYSGTFLLFCIIFELLLGIPIFLAEIIIGRRGKLNPVDAIYILALEAKRKLLWRNLGWLCFIILFSVICFYSIESAYPLAFFTSSFSGSLQESNNAQALTNLLSNQPIFLISFFLIFITVAFAVTLRGINRGLESICRIVIPGIFLIMLGLAIYSCRIGNTLAALHNLFIPTTDSLNFTVIFAAFVYAFFKLNVGMGCMMVYGSYLPLTVPLGRSALLVVGLDAILSLLAYFTLAPLVLLNPADAQTANFAYQAIPTIFATTEPKLTLTILFFLATILAAWMPTIACAETLTLIIIEKFNLTRSRATIILITLTALIGSSIILTSSDTLQWNIRAIVDATTNNLLIPISALLIAIFVGWQMHIQVTQEELGFNKVGYAIWLVAIRFIAPIAIVALLIINLYPR